jgi:hypothetical protein
MTNKQILVDLSRPPPLNISPGFNGKITTLNHNDVLCGKGRAISNYPGNVQLRAMARRKKAEYLNSSIRMEKAYICARLVLEIRSLTPPGRFLKADRENKWIEIGDKIARKKVAQVLRESAYDHEGKKRPVHHKQPSNVQQSLCPGAKNLSLPQDVKSWASQGTRGLISDFSTAVSDGNSGTQNEIFDVSGLNVKFARRPRMANSKDFEHHCMYPSDSPNSNEYKNCWNETDNFSVYSTLSILSEVSNPNLATGIFDEMSASFEGFFCEVSFCTDESEIFDANIESWSINSLNE